MSIHRQVNLAGVACPTFLDCFILTTGSPSAMLMCLGITAIDKSPLQVRFDHKRLENLNPLARGNQALKRL
jgi:hypothetical protein